MAKANFPGLYFRFFILCFNVSGIYGQIRRSQLYVGAVFPAVQQMDYEQAFRFAIEEVNKNTSILPNTSLIAVINTTESYGTFDNIKTVQYLLRRGVVAIIGPMTSTAVKYTQPYCSGFHVPQLAPVATDPIFAFTPVNFPYLVRLSPSDSLQCRALAGLIEYYNWTQMALLTSKDDYGINGLLALKDVANQRGWKIRANEHFEPIANYSDLDVRRQLRTIRQTGVRLVILNTSLMRYTLVILKQALKEGMLKNWIWIVTDGATSTEWSLIPGDYPIHEFLGVIGTRPALGTGALYTGFMNKWKARGHTSISTPGGKSFDSVLALASALDAMLKDGHSITEMSLQFDFNTQRKVTPWPPGSKLLEYIKKVKTDGIMTPLGFDANGSPRFAEYDIVNLGRTGFVKVGRWSSQAGLIMDPKRPVYWLTKSTDVPKDTANTLENRTIRVVTVVEHPFVFIKRSADGKEHFDGFCVDLLKKLQEMMKFDFKIELEPNGIYGAQDIFSQKWNGMIRHLMDGKADLALGPITISSQRQTVVDFTQPYMDVGLLIIMKKEKDNNYKVFSFLKPFNLNLWLAIVFTMLAVGVFLWFHSTFSPYGYHGRCAQVQEGRQVPLHHAKSRDYLKFFNAIWSSFAYYVSQGPDVFHPASLSGRMVVGVWWFAVLIIGATYTANLASFLIVQRFNTPIQSVEDLARQTKIRYGTIRNTQTLMFFQTSTIPTYVTMWEFMKSSESLVENTTEGIALAREGGYAFLYDSVILEYFAQHQPCETLHTVGREFGRFGYGFGLPKNSPFTLQFSVHILELRQKGYIATLKKKWLEGQCSEQSSSNVGSSASSITASGDVLSFNDMSGVFYCVFFGMAISLVVLLAELLLESYREAREGKKQGICKALLRRLKKSWKNYYSKKRPMIAVADSRQSPVGLVPKTTETSDFLSILQCPKMTLEDLETRRRNSIGREQESKTSGDKPQGNGSADYQRVVIV